MIDPGKHHNARRVLHMRKKDLLNKSKRLIARPFPATVLTLKKRCD
jgi:hypothetical protein